MPDLVMTIAWIFLLSPETGSLNALQLHTDLEEAAAVSGGPCCLRLRMILLPLMRLGLIGGMIYIFIVSFRELSSSAVLTGPNNMVMAVLIFVRDSELYLQVAALAVLMVVAMAVLVSVLRRLGRTNAELRPSKLALRPDICCFLLGCSSSSRTPVTSI